MLTPTNCIIIVIIIIIIRPHHRSAEVGLRVYMSVCLLVTFASCAKTAEPIEMSFGMLSRVGPRNHVLHGGADVARGKGHFCGLSAPLKSIGNICYSVRKNG